MNGEPRETQARARVLGVSPAALLTLFLTTGIGAETASAQDSQGSPQSGQNAQGTEGAEQEDQRKAGYRSGRTDSFSSPEDPVQRANQNFSERDNLIDFPALERFYKGVDAAKADLFKATGLKVAAFHSSVYQLASDSLPGQDDYGIATISGIYGTWDALERGDASAGQLSFGLEARWDYGDKLTPTELGTAGIGSATGTVDPYGATSPTVVVRELFWRQGSAEDGMNYRIGKITPDRLLTSSDHIDPVSLFLPVGSGGAPSIAFPDSGLGFAAGFYPSDRFRLGVVVADANGNRTDRGDIGEGNFFKAVEAQVQFLPLTEKAGFSTFTVWHTDGTDDPSNAGDSSTGEDGWGYFIKLEQELTANGRNIGIIRFGKSFDGSAAYDKQGSIRYVRIDPPDPFGLANDRFGIAASFVDAVVDPFDQDEWGIDTFYRFNLMERIQFSIAYQAIFNPTFNPDTDSVSIFSIRFSQFF